MSSLDVVGLTDFMAELLTQYAARQACWLALPARSTLLLACRSLLPAARHSLRAARYRCSLLAHDPPFVQAFTPRRQPGSVLIECEDDLWRHYALSRDWMRMCAHTCTCTCTCTCTVHMHVHVHVHVHTILELG